MLVEAKTKADIFMAPSEKPDGDVGAMVSSSEIGALKRFGT
jgi:hypothetical protein